MYHKYSGASDKIKLGGGCEPV